VKELKMHHRFFITPKGSANGNKKESFKRKRLKKEQPRLHQLKTSKPFLRLTPNHSYTRTSLKKLDWHVKMLPKSLKFLVKLLKDTLKAAAPAISKFQACLISRSTKSLLPRRAKMFLTRSVRASLWT
jgi:hypothetical protein